MPASDCQRTLHYDREPVALADLLDRYDANEFDSPHRSTVPLVALLKDQGEAFDSLLLDLGMETGCALHCEFKVKPARGKPKASQTDLMLLSDDRAVAIEAKWNEPPYETVARWLARQGKDSTKSEVLEGWIDMLRGRASGCAAAADFASATYQMVHRAASACHDATFSSAVVYLTFKPSADRRAATADHLRSRLRHLHGLLGNPGDFPFYLAEVDLEPTDTYLKLAPLRKGDRNTGVLVREALLRKEPLFRFGSFRVEEIA